MRQEDAVGENIEKSSFNQRYIFLVVSRVTQQNNNHLCAQYHYISRYKLEQESLTYPTRHPIIPYALEKEKMLTMWFASMQTCFRSSYMKYLQITCNIYIRTYHPGK